MRDISFSQDAAHKRRSSVRVRLGCVGSWILVTSANLQHSKSSREPLLPYMKGSRVQGNVTQPGAILAWPACSRHAHITSQCTGALSMGSTDASSEVPQCSPLSDVCSPDAGPGPWPYRQSPSDLAKVRRDGWPRRLSASRRAPSTGVPSRGAYKPPEALRATGWPAAQMERGALSDGIRTNAKTAPYITMTVAFPTTAASLHRTVQ